MKQQDRDQLIARITEWMKDHTYTQVVDSNGVEVWRCKKPDTNHLAFDICVTPSFMAVAGDIGDLLFRVGSGYGINFLRHQCDGYMHEKLAEAYRQVKEFDRESFLDDVVDAVCERISTDVPEDLLPDWAEEGKRDVSADDVIEWLQERADDDEPADFPFDDVASALERAQEIVGYGREADSVIAHDFLRENESVLGISDTFEWHLDKPTVSIWRRLFYVRHAANAIMAIKEQQQTEVA